MYAKDWQTSPRQYGIIEQRDLRIPLAEGITLDSDLFRPDAPGKFPLLVAANAFAKPMQSARGLLEAVPGRHRLHRGRRLQFLCAPRLCASHRQHARHRRLGRLLRQQRAALHPGPLRSDRVGRAPALVRRQCRHDRRVAFLARGQARRRLEAAAPEMPVLALWLDRPVSRSLLPWRHLQLRLHGRLCPPPRPALPHRELDEEGDGRGEIQRGDRRRPVRSRHRGGAAFGRRLAQSRLRAAHAACATFC